MSTVLSKKSEVTVLESKSLDDLLIEFDLPTTTEELTASSPLPDLNLETVCLSSADDTPEGFDIFAEFDSNVSQTCEQDAQPLAEGSIIQPIDPAVLDELMTSIADSDPALKNSTLSKKTGSNTSKPRRSNGRQYFSKHPDGVENGCSFYEYLEKIGSLKRVTEVTIAKSRVLALMGNDAMPDAIQEVHLKWLTSNTVDLSYQPSQVIYFAFKTGVNQLNCFKKGFARPVALTAQVFKKLRDNTNSDSYGEKKLDLSSDPSITNLVGLISEPVSYDKICDFANIGDSSSDLDCVESSLASRSHYSSIYTEKLKEVRHMLTDNQIKFIEMTINGQSKDTVMLALGLNSNDYRIYKNELIRLVSSYDPEN